MVIKNQQAPFELVIMTNSYTGNFERELVSYACGILDDTQMDLGEFHGDYEMDLFWEEEFNKAGHPDYHDDYELKDEYLYENYRDVDDWEQITFYYIGGHECKSLFIQLVKPLNDEWEERIIRRIKKFFEVRPTRYDFTLDKDAKLLDLFLWDAEGNKLKDYM